MKIVIKLQEDNTVIVEDGLVTIHSNENKTESINLTLSGEKISKEIIDFIENFNSDENGAIIGPSDKENIATENGKIYVLKIDGGNYGCNKTFDNLDDFVINLNKEIDSQVLSVEVKKSRPSNVKNMEYSGAGKSPEVGTLQDITNENVDDLEVDFNSINRIVKDFIIDSLSMRDKRGDCSISLQASYSKTEGWKEKINLI